MVNELRTLNSMARRRGRSVASDQDAHAFWRAWGQRNGFLNRGNQDPEPRPDPQGRSVSAYVNGGRWVADCPTCNGGIAVQPGIKHGCCLDCGTTYRVMFPPPGIITRATALLLARPLGNRNWLPWAESVKLLEAENAAHLGGL